MQAPYRAPPLAAPAAWSVQAPQEAFAVPADARWWQALHDPAIDALADAALAASPTLAQAAARVDEATAQRDATAAQQRPGASVDAGSTRSRSLNTNTSSSDGRTVLSTASSAGPALGWEIDLFGRIRYSVEAGARRVDAADADARAARLSLTAQVASQVLAARACEFSARVLAEDIDSREKTLQLTRRRLAAGFVAPVDEARAVSGLASARTSLASRQQACAGGINALVALTGQPREAVQARVNAPLAAPLPSALGRDTALGVDAVMPKVPRARLALPAEVLALHPGVVAAERQVAAAWEEIGAARADRLPRLDLSAALSGQWLRAAGGTLGYTAWSAGPALSANIFDGGRGAANVAAAEARHRSAQAALRIAVLSAAQDVEDALAAIASSSERRLAAQEALVTTRFVLNATQARWNAGAVSLFELEDARRQLAAAQDSAIAAAQDSGQAWIALVRASGNAALTFESLSA